MNNINMKHDMPPNGRDNNDNNAVITTPIEIFYQIVFLGKRLYKRANSHLSTEDQTKNLKQLIILILSIIGLLIVNTAYAVYWSFLVRRFGTSLQEKNETEFYNVIYEVLVNLLLKLPLSSLSEFWLKKAVQPGSLTGPCTKLANPRINWGFQGCFLPSFWMCQ